MGLPSIRLGSRVLGNRMDARPIPTDEVTKKILEREVECQMDSTTLFRYLLV
jgi:hypothetical protein